MAGVIFFTLLFSFSFGAELPENFKKCSLADTDFANCVLSAAQDAITQLTRAYPKVNIPNADPLEVTEISVHETNGKIFKMRQHYKSCKVYGIPRLQVHKFEFDFEKKTLEIKGLAPELRINCDYDFKGTVLNVPMDGEGMSKTTMVNLTAECLLSYDVIERRGKRYMNNFKFLKADAEQEKVIYDLRSKKDDGLDRTINKVFNDNWRTIFEDVKQDHVEIITGVFVELLNGFFSKVSMEEAF